MVEGLTGLAFSTGLVLLVIATDFSFLEADPEALTRSMAGRVYEISILTRRKRTQGTLSGLA